jgi:hypothetical protein
VSKDTWWMNTSNQFSHELITATMRLGPHTIKNMFKLYNHTSNRKNSRWLLCSREYKDVQMMEEGIQIGPFMLQIWKVFGSMPQIKGLRVSNQRKKCFEVCTSITNLSTNASSDWCHITGMILSSSTKRMKWASTASSARYGKAYFLSRNSLMK